MISKLLSSPESPAIALAQVAVGALAIKGVSALASKYIMGNGNGTSSSAPRREGPWFKSSVVPTLHGADTQAWRKHLISIAEHNVVISGNYCGTKAFEDLLEVIEKRMQEYPELKVVIIGHPKDIKDKPGSHTVKTSMERLQKEYPDQFTFVESPDDWHGAKKVTNHTKCTVIDYGKYFIQGGSGIKDRFANTGVDSETVEDYQKAAIKENPHLFDPKQEKIDHEGIEETPRSLDQGKQEGRMSSIWRKGAEWGSFIWRKGAQWGSIIQKIVDLNTYLSKNFRDQDFVFHSEEPGNDAGIKMYREALVLAYKWDQHNKSEKDWKGHRPLSLEAWDLDELEETPSYSALMDGERAQPKEEGDTSLYRMLKTPIPNMDTVNTRSMAFEKSKRKVDDASLELFFTGPEDTQSRFHQAMIDQVNNAQENIVIDHMYFQPSPMLMKALVDAAKRGIIITIVTCGSTDGSTTIEQGFAPSNRYNLQHLLKSLPDDKKKNVHYHEYDQNLKALHKKILIVDDHVMGGSSNMGFKSLELSGDHEMNFDAQSQELVDRTMEIIRKDIKNSREVTVEEGESMSVADHARALRHRSGGRIWG